MECVSIRLGESNPTHLALEKEAAVMTGKGIIAYCLSKRGAYLDYPFGEGSTVVKVKKKIFAQVFDLKGEPMATFNCDSETGEFYRLIFPGTVTRGYHCPPVQQPYFNTVRLDGKVPDAELRLMIDHAYNRVVRRLPKADREALGIEKNNY